LDLVDRIAAWTGAIVSVLGLAWRLITWRASRHKIHVNVTNIIIPNPGSDATQLVKIKAVNSGPDRAILVNWGVLAKGFGEIALMRRYPHTSKVPASLGQNEYVEFYIYAQDLRQLNEDESIPFKRMVPWVELSNGQRTYCRRHVPLA
jgi:hypothetical protein